MPSKLKKFIAGDDMDVVLDSAPAAPSAGFRSFLEIPPVSAPLNEGLTEAQVLERMENGYANINTVSATKTVRQIFHDNIFTYFNLIFFVIAVILISVGAFSNLFFLNIVIPNTVIGIIQELRAKKAVDELTILAEEKLKVLRAGKWTELPSSYLVRDDIVQFENGDQICADAVIRNGRVSVNESLLTGESDAIQKASGDELRSGSTCTSGRCIAQLTHVGAESYAARLTVEAKSNAGVGKSEMMRSLDRLIQTIGITIIPVGIALFLRHRLSVLLPIREAVRYTASGVLGMIPEGLYLLTSIALALSVVRLARRKVLVRDMSCVETLARVDTMCVDKTGTITEPGMDVRELVSLKPAVYTEERLRGMLNAFYHHMEPDNDTARAMAAVFAEDEAPEGWDAVKVIPFSSEAKWSGMTFAGEGSYVIGAPEFILRERMEEVRPFVAPYAEQGLRVLLIGHTDEELTLSGGTVFLDPARVEPAGLVCLSNRIRGEATETFQYFAKQGVDIKVISGDSPMTVSQVARQAGIEHAEQYVDATTLTTEESLVEAAGKYTVFGRVTPQQKLSLVRALKAQGHTVAMTGDGVNDVLALKEADCGIAMASGSQAASQISQLVLLNSDFASMPSIVDEGRQVINNIQRSASLFLVKTIFSFIFVLLTILIGFSYPIQPNMLSFIASCTIGMPGFFLALQKNSQRVKGHFLPNVLYRALPGALTDIVLILGVEFMAYAFGIPYSEMSTCAGLIMLVVGLVVLFDTCRPFDRYRKMVLGLMLLASLIAFGILPYTPLDWMVEMTPLNLQTGIIFVLFSLLAYPTLKGFQWIARQVRNLYRKLRGIEA